MFRLFVKGNRRKSSLLLDFAAAAAGSARFSAATLKRLAVHTSLVAAGSLPIEPFVLFVCPVYSHDIHPLR
jgi:hypothetical protein